MVRNPDRFELLWIGHFKPLHQSEAWCKTRFEKEAKGKWPIVFVAPVLPASENAKDLWEAIKPEVQVTIEGHLDQDEIIDEDDGPVEFQGDLDTALEW